MVDFFLPPRYPVGGILNCESDSYLSQTRTVVPEEKPVSFAQLEAEELRHKYLRKVVKDYLKDAVKAMKSTNFERPKVKAPWITEILDHVYKSLQMEQRSLSTVFGSMCLDSPDSMTCSVYEYYFLLRQYFPDLTKEQMDAIWNFSVPNGSSRMTYRDFERALSCEKEERVYSDIEINRAMILLLDGSTTDCIQRSDERMISTITNDSYLELTLRRQY